MPGYLQEYNSCYVLVTRNVQVTFRVLMLFVSSSSVSTDQCSRLYRAMFCVFYGPSGFSLLLRLFCFSFFGLVFFRLSIGSFLFSFAFCIFLISFFLRFRSITAKRSF